MARKKNTQVGRIVSDKAKGFAEALEEAKVKSLARGQIVNTKKKKNE